MLAVYHLASGKVPASEMPGIPNIIDKAGISELPRARIAVLDGIKASPNQPVQHGSIQVHTLWGDLAWQLGGEEGYALVASADQSGTSPGKDVLQQLLEKCAPCVILIDELVAYIRQFEEGKALSGGSFDSNLSFVQALAEWPPTLGQLWGRINHNVLLGACNRCIFLALARLVTSRK